MAQISNMVNKINIIAKTGLYGSPKNPAFMNNVSKDYFTNVSSPIKAAAFAQYYKQYNKKSTPMYKPMEKLGGVTPIKKLLKSVHKGKKGKKASPKKETNFKKLALAAKAAKEAYYLQIYGPNYKPPTKAKKGEKSSIKMYSPSSSTSSSKSSKSSTSSKSSKRSKSSKSSKMSSANSRGSSATSVSSYQNSMISASR